jgi:hypothetical protein
MINRSLGRIFAMIGDIFVIVRSHSECTRRTEMTALTSETHAMARSTGPSPHIAVTLDQLVAPLEIPAELHAARWAPKWTLTLPIALLAAFTLPARTA